MVGFLFAEVTECVCKANPVEKLRTFNATKAFNGILKNKETGDLTVDEATVTNANDEVRMSVVAESIHYDAGKYNADLYVLLEVK